MSGTPIVVMATHDGMVHLVIHPITFVLSPRDAAGLSAALRAASDDASGIEIDDDSQAPADVIEALDVALADLGIARTR